MKKICLLLSVIFSAFLSSCSEKQVYFTSTDELNKENVTIGVGTGSASESYVLGSFKNATIKYFDDEENGYLAVETNKIDAYCSDSEHISYAIQNGLTGVKVIKDSNTPPIKIAVGVSRKTNIPNLTGKLNEFIKKSEEDGTLADLKERWVINGQKKLGELPVAENTDLTLVIGTSGLIPAYNFYYENELTGMDIEFAYRFAYYINAKLEIKVYNFEGLVAAAETGVLDCIFSNLNITKERAEKIDFSIPYTLIGQEFIVREQKTNEKFFRNLSDFENATIAVQTGTTAGELLEKKCPNAEIKYTNTTPDSVLLVTKSKADALITDGSTAKIIEEKNDTLSIFSKPFDKTSYAFVFKKNNPLKAKFDKVLEQMKKDGTLDDLYKKWTSDDEDLKVMPKKDWKGKNGTFSYYAEPFFEPFSYYKDGKIVGIDTEIIYLIAKELDMNVEIFPVDFTAILASIQSGKGDVGGSGISITKERKEVVDFSVPYYSTSYVFVVRKTETTNSKTFLTSLKLSFERNFVKESRWKMVVNGLLITILISVLSLITGLVLGFIICMLRRSKNLFAKSFSISFIKIIQGMPIIVLLMILYYIIFAKTAMSGIIVAIIGFALNFAAYSCEIIRSGFDSIDIGQTEASLALGYSKTQTFWKVVFPQAAQRFIPVLKGQFISMVKETSVVGYIAVQDLTKVSDIIRSRTMEAFFPLITTALVYFVIANILTMFLSRFEKSIDPKSRKNILKDVIGQNND